MKTVIIMWLVSTASNSNPSYTWYIYLKILLMDNKTKLNTRLHYKEGLLIISVSQIFNFNKKETLYRGLEIRKNKKRWFKVCSRQQINNSKDNLVVEIRCTRVIRQGRQETAEALQEVQAGKIVSDEKKLLVWIFFVLLRSTFWNDFQNGRSFRSSKVDCTEGKKDGLLSVNWTAKSLKVFRDERGWSSFSHPEHQFFL